MNGSSAGSRLKAVFVGLGGIGQRHLRNLRMVLGDAVEVHAYRVRRTSPVLTDRLEPIAGENLEALYDVHVHGSLEAALATSPDVAFICNPSSLHVPTALAAARAGCHLFLEKPVSHDLEGLDELRAVVQERNLAAVVGYQLRFHPCVKQLKAWWEADLIGRPVAMQVEVGEHLADWHRYEDYRTMYAARADLGGGVILSQIHEFDYLYDLLGLPVRIAAFGGHLTGLEIDVEDVAVSVLEFMLRGRPLPVALHQDYIQRPVRRRCVVIGDAGRISIDLAGLKAERSAADGKVVESHDYAGFARNEMFIAELQHFLACVRGEVLPLVSLDDGIASLKIALAVKEAMRSRRILEFEP